MRSYSKPETSRRSSGALPRWFVLGGLGVLAWLLLIAVGYSFFVLLT